MPPGDVADPLLHPTSGDAFTTATSPKRLQACQYLLSPPMRTRETKTESPAEAAAARLLPTSGRSTATTAAPPTTAAAPASPATQPTLLPAQATGRALGALPLLYLHPPNLLQAGWFRNQNTTNIGRYYGSRSGTQAVSQTEPHELESASTMTSLTSASFMRLNSCLKTPHHPFRDSVRYEQTDLPTQEVGGSSHSFETI